MDKQIKSINDIKPGKINAIFAVDSQGGIGYKNQLPWPHITEDMKHFRALTDGDVVIMGHNTWNSIDMVHRPLKGRVNVVMTNTPIVCNLSIHDYRTSFATIQGSLEIAISVLQEHYRYKHIWIIGGASILNQSIDLIDSVYLTRINQEFVCDTFVDVDKLLTGFESTYIEFLNKGDYNVTFEHWQRSK